MPKARPTDEIMALEASDTREPKRRYVLGVQKKGVGRKETTITQAGLGVVERMAKNGHSDASISKSLNISHRCFKDLKIRDPRVQEALDAGRGGFEDELVDLLLEVARNREHKMQPIILMFLAKARCGWVEGGAPERQPNVVIHLPDSMSPDEYSRAITVQHASKGELPE